MASPVVEFRNVSRVYHLGGEAIKAVDQVSFSILPGEFVAITGQSGSGKSTLLHLIGLLDRPTSGQIFLDGGDVSTMNNSQLAKMRNAKIGFVFQQFNLLSKTSAWRNVELPLLYRGVGTMQREKMAKESLQKVGLEQRFYNTPAQLSGGQQQRVAIARALVGKPSLLLADEPTGNLDSKTGEGVIKLFKDLHQGGATIILVTHDINIGRQAKRQIGVRDGRIIHGHT